MAEFAHLNWPTCFPSDFARYRMTLDEFLTRLGYLAQAIDAVDQAAHNDYQLSSS